MTGGRTRGDTGSATVWVLIAAGLVLAAGLTATLVSSAVLIRHRAESAADLAALATADAAVEGRAAACARGARVAAAGGARLVSCSLVDATAEVLVVLRGRGLFGRLPPVRVLARAGPSGLVSGAGGQRRNSRGFSLALSLPPSVRASVISVPDSPG